MSRLLALINGYRAFNSLPETQLNPRVPATAQLRRVTSEHGTLGLYVLRVGLIGPDSFDIVGGTTPIALGENTFFAIHADRYDELTRVSFSAHPELPQVRLLDDANIEYVALNNSEIRRFYEGYDSSKRHAIVSARSRR